MFAAKLLENATVTVSFTGALVVLATRSTEEANEFAIGRIQVAHQS
jgi:hypothetical protein